MDEIEVEAAVKRREKKIVNSLCSFQNRLGPPEYRKWRRIHGLQLPLHPQQVVGWIVLASVAAATFLVLIPSLRTSFRDCLFVVFGVLFGVHVISHVAALLLDPADPELRALKVKVVVPQFDRTKRAHVIENGHCHLCNIDIKGPRTKHCSVCNKCIDKFDHHCKWLNHCIGGRNYVAFFICVVTAVVASLMVGGISVLEIVYYHTDPDSLDIFPERYNATTSNYVVNESVFLGVVYILALLAATTAGLLLHLCLFHCYISFLGVTTYEYIRSYPQGAAVSTTFFPYNFNCKKLEVMSNQISSSDQVQNNRRCFKFESGCCYSRSRPPENEDHDANGPVHFCEGFRARFKRCQSDSDGLKSPKKKVRKLERQDTDPEFVDRVVKPFVITLGDENKAEAEEGRVSYCCATKPAKKHCCSRLKSNTGSLVGEEDSDKTCEPHVDSVQTVLKIGRADSVSSGRSAEGSRIGKFWRLYLENAGKSRQIGDADATSRIKCNQIRPKSDEGVNNTLDKIISVKSEDRTDMLNPKLSLSTDELNKLPDLRGPVRKLQNSSELKEITTVLDFAEQPNFALQRSMRSNLRRNRKKVFSRRPRSPSLSPIRESGLSNPGSPRVNTVSPLSTPILARASSPEMSTIFLSNPNSPCSSDGDSSSPSPIPQWTKRSSGDVLETPQLPRKMYSPKDPVFMVKPSKFRSSTLVDIESREGV